MQKESVKQIHTYLSFDLGEEKFAISVNNVSEILELCPVTRIPKAPSFMAGVINLRGKVLPLLDARILLGLKAKEYTLSTSVIVLDIMIMGQQTQIGILVDGLDQVLEIDLRQVEPYKGWDGTRKSDYITGMLKIDKKFILILDASRVFYEEGSIALEQFIPEDMPL